jgi:predicted transcriptional regulator of viral defense system
MRDIVVQAPNHEQLFAIASEQAGFFTAAQARECGFDWDVLSYHAGRGRFIRTHRGLYRLRDFPFSQREEVMAAWLAVGKDVAVVSHETALDILNLSDVTPHAVHLTVPRSRRPRRKVSLPSLPGTIIHTTNRPFGPLDLTSREGVRLTSATRTIVDAAETGTGSEQIGLAVAQAIERDLATAASLREEAGRRSRRVAEQVSLALSGLER